VQPLVSIIVITYNSEKYVLETLESARAQTYQNIELIVSDDGSKDNTVEICRKWIEENKNRFVRTELITVEKNTGVTANCNRGLLAAHGEWIKYVAGDDILVNFCIEEFLNAVNDKIKIICSEIKEFRLDHEAKIEISEKGSIVNPAFIKLHEARKQFNYFLKGFYIPGSGLFLERNKLIDLDGFDERYRNSEIRPLLLKYTYNNIRIHYLPCILVFHRRHPGAVTAKTDRIIALYLKEAYEAIRYYSKFCGNILLKINAIWHIWLIKLIFSAGNRGTLCNLLNSIRLNLQPLRINNLLVRAHLLSE